VNGMFSFALWTDSRGLHMPDEKSPDWKFIVHKRIGCMRLPPAQQEEIITELSAHLEDVYTGHLEKGMPQPDALHRSLEEVAHWAAACA
jgi:hypothetical protein